MFALRRTIQSSATARRLPATVLARWNHNTTGSEPDLDTAKAMPLSTKAMDNSTLVTLGSMGHHGANKEILRRHIMVVDQVDYSQACQQYQIISQSNKKNMYLLTLPYHLGIGMAVSAGILSLPMVFHLPMAEWFNTHYVTTDVPEPQDLETMLETGSWTWNWMEPPLGTISFVLLALQFSRAQMQNLGVKPFTDRVKNWRAEQLAKAFPQYDPSVIMAYSRSATIQAKSSKYESY